MITANIQRRGGDNKALYGETDRRENLYAIDRTKEDPAFVDLLNQQACSVACMTLKQFLIKEGDGTRYRWRQEIISTLGQRKNLADGEAFSDEPVLGYGTAWLFSEQAVLTAAHCVCLEDSNELDRPRIRKTRLVFNVRMVQKGECKTTSEKNEVYKVEQVTLHNFSRSPQPEGWNDWAILKLDRKVEGRIPLKINFGDIVNGTRLYMMGHPNGIPLKRAKDAQLTKTLQTVGYFDCNVDAFAGNSGSPVFNEETNEVVGMLCAGKPDYDLDLIQSKPGQMKYKVHYVTPEERLLGDEKCQKMSPLDLVKNYINQELKIAEAVEGLNLKGICQNTGCSTFQLEFFINKKFGEFDLGREMVEHDCPYCGRLALLVSIISLKSCVFSYQAVNEEGEPLMVENEKEEAEVSMDLSDWKFCRIKVDSIIL